MGDEIAEIKKRLEKLEERVLGERGGSVIDAMSVHDLAAKIQNMVWEKEGREKVKEDPTILLPYTYELERRTRG